MFIRVKLLNGLPEPLWYSVPQNLSDKPLSGLIVQVPVRNRVIPALVLDEHTSKPYNRAFDLKEICGIEPLPDDKHYQQCIKKLGDYYQIEPLYFIKRIHQFLANKKLEEFVSFDKLRTNGTEVLGGAFTAEQALRTSGREKAHSTNSNVMLTDEQQ